MIHPDNSNGGKFSLKVPRYILWNLIGNFESWQEMFICEKSAKLISSLHMFISTPVVILVQVVEQIKMNYWCIYHKLVHSDRWNPLIPTNLYPGVICLVWLFSLAWVSLHVVSITFKCLTFQSPCLFWQYPIHLTLGTSNFSLKLPWITTCHGDVEVCHTSGGL